MTAFKKQTHLGNFSVYVYSDHLKILDAYGTSLEIPRGHIDWLVAYYENPEVNPENAPIITYRVKPRLMERTRLRPHEIYGMSILIHGFSQGTPKPLLPFHVHEPTFHTLYRTLFAGYLEIEDCMPRHEADQAGIKYYGKTSVTLVTTIEE